MNSSFRHLSQTSAIALGLMLTQPIGAFAQPYDALSGIIVPPCGNNAIPVDAGTLGADAFGNNGKITADVVAAASARGEVCIKQNGKLKLSGDSAGMAGVEATPSVADLANALANGNGQANADGSDDRPAVADVAQNPEPAADVPAVETETAEAEPVAPEAEPIIIDEPAVEPTNDNQGRDTVLGDIQVPTQEPAQEPIQEPAQPEQAEVVTNPEPAPTREPVAAASDANGRNAEPAQVQETTVTEENSRSSSEEFSSNAQGSANANANANANASNNSSDGGLSNLEKFAIGAAGIVALKAIIGNNREVVSNSGDRVIIRDQNGDLEVLRDDDTLLRRPGSDVKTETFSDGSTRTTITRSNGSQIVTIADASGRVIKRTRIAADGREILLIDDTEEVRPVDVTRLPTPAPRVQTFDSTDRQSLEAALRAKSRSTIDRRFTLRQVREYREVRDIMPEINIDAINFASGSAAIQPGEAEELFDLGQAMSDFIRENPDELFLVEGHTDAVGDAAYNLALSDRRAESVALALSEYFEVPPENMIIQGYGEGELLVRTTEAERANRRAVVRRVTPLLR